VVRVSTERNVIFRELPGGRQNPVNASLMSVLQG
jgi:hypothetical protein